MHLDSSVRPLRPVLAAAMLSLGACDFIGPRACTLEAAAGINVRVLDARTNASLDGASGVIRSGSYTEDAQPVGSGFLAGAYERAGTYTVTVRRDGYRNVVFSDVRVTKDHCHVRARLLTAKMQPAA